jgi:RimJ/RimL family protein N-acetyltransferase
MRHSLKIEGFGVRLRPVRMEDAAFIVWLRNLEYVRGKVGDSATSLAGQVAWLKKYFEREGDYYFIVETPGGIPLGTHGIYDVQGTSAEKGRHIIRPETMAGVPAGLLATDLGFGQLGMSELRATCVSTNVTVRSLHRRSGFKQVGILRAGQTINGQPVDLVQFLLTPEDWAGVRDSLLPLARLAGNLVLEWEKAQAAGNQPWIETKTKDGPQRV